MILEGIVTTLSPEGALNIAPMGSKLAPDLGLRRFELRPYQASTTFRNLQARGEGVFHVTDDVVLLAQTAIDLHPRPTPKVLPAERVAGKILADACRYYEFRVVAIDSRDARARIAVETVAEGRLRDFLGFNRARHAIVEAAILATRTSFLPRSEILHEFSRLAIIVEKTGGDAELEAFRLLQDHVTGTPPA